MHTGLSALIRLLSIDSFRNLHPKQVLGYFGCLHKCRNSFSLIHVGYFGGDLCSTANLNATVPVRNGVSCFSLIYWNGSRPSCRLELTGRFPVDDSCVDVHKRPK